MSVCMHEAAESVWNFPAVAVSVHCDVAPPAVSCSRPGYIPCKFGVVHGDVCSRVDDW